jgi:hypothetical protein
MAKNSITEYDTTAANNTDIGGIDIRGSANVANFDDGLATLMKHIADFITGDSFIHDTYKIADSDAETKLAKFDAGSITAGQTRTFTFPDKDGTFAMAADVSANTAVALIDSSDDGSKNTALNIPSGTTAQEPSSPDGVQIRYDTDLSALRLYDGTSYTSFGAGAVKYDAAQSLSDAEKEQARENISTTLWEHVSTTEITSSVAYVDFTGLGDFKEIKVSFIFHSASDGANLYLRTSNDGVTFDTSSNYNITTFRSYHGGHTHDTGAGANLLKIIDNVGSASDEYCFGEIRMCEFNQAVRSVMFGQGVSVDSGADCRANQTTGFDAAASARSAIRFYFSSGNISSGEVIIEGIRS